MHKVHRPDIQDAMRLPVNFASFDHQKIKYIWRPDINQFIKLRGLEKERCGILYTISEGYSSSESELMLKLYGSNVISTDIEPIWKIILREV